MAKPQQKPQGKGKDRGEKLQPGQMSHSTPAKVTEIVRRTGATGEITQIRCELMEGNDQGRVLRRNVKGPIQLGDILMLKQTMIEAADIRQV